MFVVGDQGDYFYFVAAVFTAVHDAATLPNVIDAGVY